MYAAGRAHVEQKAARLSLTDLLCPEEKELSGFIKYLTTRGRKSFVQTQALLQSPHTSQLLQSECGASSDAIQPWALGWQEKQWLLL